MPIKVCIVDDHTMFRAAISHLITRTHEIEVAAEFDRGEQALNWLRSNPVDVVLCDLLMPGMGGAETLRRVARAHPDTGLLALTAEADVHLAREVIDQGVHAYVTKDADPDELIKAIMSAARGGKYVSQNIAQLIALYPKQDSDPFEALSTREQQVLRMVLEGRAGNDIAELLCVSPKTVSTYRTRLYDKLGVKNDVELFKFAVRRGYVTLDE